MAKSLSDTPKARVNKLAKETNPGTLTRGRKDLENFNTRLISDLFMEMKIYCVQNKIKMQDFVNEAIQEKLKASKQ